MTTKEKYREFCKIEKNIPIFSKDWWLDSVCGYDNWDVVLVERNENIIAVMPFCRSDKSIFKMITMPKLTQTMGPYIKYPPNQKYEKKLSYEKEIMNLLIKQLPVVEKYSQNFHYNITNWLPFYWNGYTQTTRYTYVIENLNDLGSVFNNFSSSYRNKVRRAQEIVTVKKSMNIEDFYKINMMTFDRQNIKYPYTLEFILNHDKYLVNNNSREIFYAEDSTGAIHSALYLTWDNNSSYVHMVGEDPNLRNSGAGILLVWEAIKYTTEVLNLNKFDFEGSMIEGVEQVRRSFGAIQKSYFNISKTNSKLLKIKQLVKEIIK